MYYAQRLDSITVATSPKPGQQEIMDFKKRVKEALKHYDLNGQMEIRADGSFVQKFSRASK